MPSARVHLPAHAFSVLALLSCLHNILPVFIWQWQNTRTGLTSVNLSTQCSAVLQMSCDQLF